MEATFEISKEYLIEVKTYSDEDGKRIISQENYNIVGTNEYDDFTYAFSEPGEIVSRDLIEFVFLNGQRVDRIRASHYSGPIEFDQFGQPTKIMESVRGRRLMVNLHLCRAGRYLLVFSIHSQSW